MGNFITQEDERWHDKGMYTCVNIGQTRIFHVYTFKWLSSLSLPSNQEDLQDPKFLWTVIARLLRTHIHKWNDVNDEATVAIRVSFYVCLSHTVNKTLNGEMTLVLLVHWEAMLKAVCVIISSLWSALVVVIVILFVHGCVYICIYLVQFFACYYFTINCSFSCHMAERKQQFLLQFYFPSALATFSFLLVRHTYKKE